jgi:3-dehydroquinate synthetase
MLLKMPILTREHPSSILAAMQSEKKKRDGRLRFVLPREIGDVEYGVVVPDRKVESVLKRLTTLPGGDEFR